MSKPNVEYATTRTRLGNMTILDFDNGILMLDDEWGTVSMKLKRKQGLNLAAALIAYYGEEKE